MAIVLVISVAVTKGITPKRPICGCHTVPVKNSSKVTPGVLKNSQDCTPKTMTMPIVVRIERIPVKNNNL